MRPNDFDVMTIADYQTAWEELHCNVSHMRSECKFRSSGLSKTLDMVLEKMDLLEKMNLISIDYTPAEVKKSEPPVCQAW